MCGEHGDQHGHHAETLTFALQCVCRADRRVERERESARRTEKGGSRIGPRRLSGSVAGIGGVPSSAGR